MARPADEGAAARASSGCQVLRWPSVDSAGPPPALIDPGTPCIELDILGDDGPPALAHELNDRSVLSIHAEAALALPAGAGPLVDHLPHWLSDHGGLAAPIHAAMRSAWRVGERSVISGRVTLELSGRLRATGVAHAQLAEHSHCEQLLIGSPVNGGNEFRRTGFGILNLD